MPPRPRPKRRTPGRASGLRQEDPVDESFLAGLPPRIAPTNSFSAHEQADPRDEVLAAFGTESMLDPMARLEMQGQRLRDAKRRLRDPGSPRRLRVAAAGLLALVALPFVLTFVVLAVAQIASLFD